MLPLFSDTSRMNRLLSPSLPRLFAVVFLLAGWFPQLSAIESAFSRYYSEDEIRPLGHYFGNFFGEQGFRTVIASDSTDFSGHYFILNLSNATRAVAALVELSYILTDSTEQRKLSWDLGRKPLKSWVYLGITGSQWQGGRSVQPLAWQVVILRRDGTPLTQWSSFLWEQPAAQ